MSIKKEVMDEFNKQINEELYSAYLYLQMSAYFETQNLKGFAQWLKKQSEEEVKHAMKFYKHITDRMGSVELQAIKAPQIEWKGPLDAFDSAFKHEQHITARINLLIDLVEKHKDNPAKEMLQWFVKEQVEEEQQTDEIVQKLKMINNSPGGLMVLDHHLEKRQ